jgi:hypothetical protein
MAHAALLSTSLYRLPTLPNELSALGVVPGPTGYDTLRNSVSISTQLSAKKISPPSKRTVEKMMIHGDFVKYVTCGNIVHLLNVARGVQNLGPVGSNLIEESEYVVIGIQRALENVGRGNGGTTAVEIAIAERINRPRGLIRAMKKNYRTTLDRCQVVVDAITSLYGITLAISNEYSSARPEPITQGMLDL